MNRNYKLVSALLFFAVALSSTLLYADNQDYYKVDADYLQANDVGDRAAIISMLYDDGSFDVYPFNDDYNILIYNDDEDDMYAVPKVADYILTFPANGEKLRLFMARSDDTSTGRGYGFIDQNENVVLEPTYELGDCLFNGVATMGMFDKGAANGQLYCLVDENGKQLTDLKYRSIDRFMMPQSFAKQSSKFTFNSFNSDYFKDYVPLDYATFIADYGEAIPMISTQRTSKFPTPHRQDLTKKGVLDKAGNEILPPIYFDVRIGDNEIIAVSSKLRKYGYINLAGEELLPVQYALTTRFRNGKAAVVKDDKLAFIDENFNIIQDFKAAPYWKDIYYMGDIDLLVDTYYQREGGAANASSWAKPYIALADGIGLLDDNIKAKYTGNISRAQYCQLVVAAIFRNAFVNENMSRGELQRTLLNMAMAKSDQNPFADTDNLYVKLAYQMGIVNGKTANTFDPDGDITRQEAAVMLIRAYQVCTDNAINGYNPQKNHFLERKFNDFNEISDWAEESVFHVNDKKFMNGVSDSQFAPLGSYTVEQSIATIIRLYLEI